MCTFGISVTYIYIQCMLMNASIVCYGTTLQPCGNVVAFWNGVCMGRCYGDTGIARALIPVHCLWNLCRKLFLIPACNTVPLHFLHMSMTVQHFILASYVRIVLF